MPRNNSQIIGNVGLYYVSYRLSKMNWNVMPTSRNARGIDAICFNLDGTKMISIQVKTLSKISPVPLGSTLDHILANFWVIVNNVSTEIPKSYILFPNEVKALAHKGVKDGKISYWLQPKSYCTSTFLEKWDRIGFGNY